MKLHYLAAAALLTSASALAWAPKTDPGVEPTWEQTAPIAGDPNLDLAVKPDTAVPEVAVAKVADPDMAVPDMAIPETADPEAADVGIADTGTDGIGGPAETADATTIAAIDPSPRPAAQNYPACRPGPGDDSCIQLYEPGVRTALASWNQPTGGLADGKAPSATAMGGPYEPVESDSAETAMNGDGSVDGAVGETEDVELSGI